MSDDDFGFDAETETAYDFLVRRLCARIADLEQQLADARLEIVAGRAVREELEEKAQTWEATAETGAYIRDSAECQNLRAERAAALEVIETIASPDWFGKPHELAREFLAGRAKAAEE